VSLYQPLPVFFPDSFIPALITSSFVDPLLSSSRPSFWIASNFNCNGHNCRVQLRRPIRVIVHDFVAIGQTFAEMRQFLDFKKIVDRHVTFSKVTN